MALIFRRARNTAAVPSGGTPDEHFYENGLNFNFNYHWPLHGFGLPDDVLKKVYRENALPAFRQARDNAA